MPDTIFVFGSNLSGRHGKGAAKHAVEYFGAANGVARGYTGRSYAIPTKDLYLKALPLQRISQEVEFFLLNARMDSLRTFSPLFLVTRIGCGLTGYSDTRIAPLFASRRPPNTCGFDPKWKRYGLQTWEEAGIPKELWEAYG